MISCGAIKSPPSGLDCAYCSMSAAALVAAMIRSPVRDAIGSHQAGKPTLAEIGLPEAPAVYVLGGRRVESPRTGLLNARVFFAVL